MPTELTALHEESVQLAGGPRLVVRRAKGEKRPFLLVHGLASNALMWELVGVRLSELGHEVVSVDLRGHGRSERPDHGHSTGQSAADLAQLIRYLDWGPTRRPIICGQSWGGNVVLRLAATTDLVRAVAAVDGGWIHLADRYPKFAECWEQLAPPDFGATTWTELRSRLGRMLQGWPDGSLKAVLGNLEETAEGMARNRLAREHHRSILHSLWTDDPLDDFSSVTVPSLFLVAGTADKEPEKAAAVSRAASAVSNSMVRWYPGAHHDLHLQHPDQVTVDLLSLLDLPTDTAGAT